MIWITKVTFCLESLNVTSFFLSLFFFLFFNIASSVHCNLTRKVEQGKKRMSYFYTNLSSSEAVILA